MDRLKQEWKESQIPEEVCLRARNAAWAKTERPVQAGLGLIWATAASVIIIAAVVLLVWSSQKSRIDRVSAPERPEISAPTKTTNLAAGIGAEKPATPQIEPVREQSAQKGTSRSARRIQLPVEPADEPQRVVLNMTLPETGAHMIWIMDSNFHF
jgi:hypothetical protein